MEQYELHVMVMSRHAIPAVTYREFEALPRMSAARIAAFPVVAQFSFHRVVPVAPAITLVAPGRCAVSVRFLVLFVARACDGVLRFVVRAEVVLVLPVLVAPMAPLRDDVSVSSSGSSGSTGRQPCVDAAPVSGSLAAGER